VVAAEALGLGDKAEQSFRISTRECGHDSKDTSIDVWTPGSEGATLAIGREEKVLRVLRSKKRKWAAAAVGVVLMGTLAAVAFGSPGFGTTQETFVTANFEHSVHWNSDSVKFQTKEPTDVRVQKLVFAAGSFSGWHHHPGIIIVTVQSGAVTLMDSDCNSKTYGPGLPNGAVFVEGGDEPVQATSVNGATNYLTFVAPSADPPVFRIEDEPPACAT
jgi:hypothetical protein